MGMRNLDREHAMNSSLLCSTKISGKHWLVVGRSSPSGRKFIGFIEAGGEGRMASCSPDDLLKMCKDGEIPTDQYETIITKFMEWAL